MKRFELIAIALLFVLTAGHGSLAEEPESQPATQPSTQPATAPASQPATQPAEEEEEEKEKDKFLVVTGGTVHTVSGPVLRDATIVCKNGRIHAIGHHVPMPEPGDDREVITVDASGMRVYPGLVAAGSSGIFGAGDPRDSTDVFSLTMNIALAGGITTAVSDNSAMKLTFGTLDDILVKNNLFTELRYSTDSPEARRTLRQDLDKVRQYIRDLEAYEQEKKRNPEAKEPDKEWLEGKYKDYLALMKGEKTAVSTCNRAHEILQLCALAEEYGIRFVVRGAVEGWTVPRHMSRAKMSAIVTPRQRWGEDERLNRPTGWSIANAATLHAAGVPIAIIPALPSITLWGLAGRDLLHLNMEAGFAVRGGLSNEAALEAITIGAARILGIDAWVGSIEEGKDADLVICDGDILHYMTQVHKTVVNGRVVYDKAEDPLYRHIRPEGTEESVEPDDYWPRRLGADVNSNGELMR